MTVVTDLKTGRILHAFEGKSKEDIRPFLEKLARKAKRLEGIAMDMSSAYYNAVIETLPRVNIIFDPYHIMALINQAIEDLRRDQQRELDRLGQQTLKGNRFLLLRNYHDLKPDRKSRLDALLHANQPLFIIYPMKEQLRLFREKENGTTARIFLETRCRDALNSGIKQLIKVWKDFGQISNRPAQLLQTPHHQRHGGRNQQQHQNTQKTGLWIQRQRIL
jgi:transposase